MNEWVPLIGGIILLLWLFLGVAVGIHAQEYNRSGILWFLAVTITGIFGFMFYMLAITPSNTDEQIDSQSINHKIATKGPILIVSGILGSICGFFIGLPFAEALVSLTVVEIAGEYTYYISPYDSLTVPITALSTLLGASVFARGSYIHGFRQILHYLSHALAVFIGMFGAFTLLSLVGLVPGGFQSGILVLLPPLFLLGGGVVSDLLWNWVYNNWIQDWIQSAWDYKLSAS